MDGMSLSVVLVLVLAAVAANLPFVNERLFVLGPRRVPAKSLGWRLLELLCFGAAVVAEPDAIGRGLNVFCQVRMKSHDPVARRDFERFVESHDEVLECYSMSGEWDYLLRVVAADVRDYERLLMHGILTHEAVANSSSHFALKSVKYTTALPV